MLYFDNAATTYPKPEQVYKEMDRLTRECAVNSGRGSYKKAENASAVINETRKKVSEFMGAENPLQQKLQTGFCVDMALKKI